MIEQHAKVAVITFAKIKAFLVSDSVTGGVAWYQTTKDIRLAHVQTSTANPGSVKVMIPGGGFAIGVQMTYRTSAQPTHTWTGLVEDYDSMPESGGSSHSGAYLAVGYGGGKFVDVTCTPSSFSSGGTVVAAFR